MTNQQEADERRRLERAREIALFRYSLVQEVISPQLTPAQWGARVRELAAAAHAGPGGAQVRVSYQSINRWKRAYLEGGFEALIPAPRQASPRTPAEVLELAAALKRENPARTAAQVQRILRTTSGVVAVRPHLAAAVRPARARPRRRAGRLAAGVRALRG